MFRIGVAREKNTSCIASCLSKGRAPGEYRSLPYDGQAEVIGSSVGSVLTNDRFLPFEMTLDFSSDKGAGGWQSRVGFPAARLSSPFLARSQHYPPSIPSSDSSHC